MTLAELKNKIIGIENQLSSIDIPIKKGLYNIDIDFGLSMDKESKVIAIIDIYYEKDNVNPVDKVPIAHQIRDLKVGDYIDLPFRGTTATNIQVAASKAGKVLNRKFSTKTDRTNGVIRVVRVE